MRIPHLIHDSHFSLLRNPSGRGGLFTTPDIEDTEKTPMRSKHFFPGFSIFSVFISLVSLYLLYSLFSVFSVVNTLLLRERLRTL